MANYCYNCDKKLNDDKPSEEADYCSDKCYKSIMEGDD